MGDLPEHLALVEVDGGDAPIRRLEDGEPLHGEAPAAAAPATGGGWGALRRGRRRHAPDMGQAGLGEIAGQEPPHRIGVVGKDVHHVGFGIERAARPLRRPIGGGNLDRAQPVGPLADDGRGEEMAPIVVLQQAQRFGPQRRGEVDDLRDGQPLHVEGRRLCRHRLGGGIPFAGHVALGHRRFGDRPDRLAVGAVEHEGKGVLGRLRQRLDGAAAHLHVEQDRRAHIVAIPDIVMHRLVIPAALAGLGIDRDDTVGEEVRPGPEGAVIIVGGLFDGQIDQPQFGIGAVLRPVADIAGGLGRAVQPGLVALLALARHGMEYPEPLAGPDVEAADETLDVPGDGDRGRMRRAHHHDIAHHQRRGMQADLLARTLAVQVDVLVVVPLEIDHAVRAETRIGLAGLRIQRDQLIADGDVEDAFRIAVAPIADAMAAAGTRRVDPALALVEIKAPFYRAGARIQRQHGALEAGGGIEHTVHHQRRRLQIDVARLGMAPGRFEPAEIRGIDLGQRRIAQALLVAAIAFPFAVGGVITNGLLAHRLRCGQRRGKRRRGKGRRGRAAGEPGHGRYSAPEMVMVPVPLQPACP